MAFLFHFAPRIIALNLRIEMLLHCRHLPLPSNLILNIVDREILSILYQPILFFVFFGNHIRCVFCTVPQTQIHFKRIEIHTARFVTDVWVLIRHCFRLPNAFQRSLDYAIASTQPDTCPSTPECPQSQAQ
jgi:hypothetical protein